MKNIKILLAPTLEFAKKISATATIEAEYGNNIVKGTQVTLAHHVIPGICPCLANVVPLKKGDIILISHIDLDTLGGCLALMGINKIDDEFWESVAFIDENGAHNLYQLDLQQQLKLNAIWAWSAKQPRECYTENTDVTETILTFWNAVKSVLKGNRLMLKEGQKWFKENNEAVEAHLVEETKTVKIFKTEQVFCNASYYSPLQKMVIPCIIALNTNTKAITISFADGGKKYSAVRIVQKLWGPEAGGHAGIAGSPRGWKKNFKRIGGGT